MALTTHDTRLFGLDLQALGRDLRSPWQDMHRWPILAWLTPVAQIRLWQVDGSSSIWLDTVEQRPASAPNTGNQRFNAIELPEDILLRRRITMPALPEKALAEAVTLEVNSVSPFAPEELAWGFCAKPSASGAALDIDLVIASRKHIEQHVLAQASRLPAGTQAEVWALSEPPHTPIVITGYGETRRWAYARLWRRVSYALLLLAIGVAMTAALTPTLRLYFRAKEAVHAYDAVHKRASPAMRQRESVVQASERVTVLRDLLADRVDPLRTMNFLTQALPDDTALFSVQVQGSKVSLTGQTVNTAALMQQLGTQKGVRDVRAPTAATKPLGTLKESFSIEFNLDAKALEPEPSSTAAPNQAPPSVPAAAPAPAPASKASAPVPAPAATASSPMPTSSKPAPTASKAK